MSFTGGTAGPSNATGGVTNAGWDQGDLVISFGEGNATGGTPAGAAPLGIGWGTWAIAGALVVGAVVWMRSR